MDVLPADDRLRILGRGEQLRDGVADERVAFVLQRAQLVELVARVAKALEPVDRLVELGRRSEDHLRLLARLPGHTLYAVDAEVVRGLVHVVADVVERAGETVHVVAVERRHESAVEEVDHLVCQAVTLVLAVLDLLHQAAAVLGKALEELYEQPRDLDRVRGCLRVQ